MPNANPTMSQLLLLNDTLTAQLKQVKKELAAAVRVARADEQKKYETARFEAEVDAIRRGFEGKPPFTVINFNSIQLRMTGQFQRYTVPGNADKHLPPNAFRFTLRFKGVDRTGVGITIIEPQVFGKPLGVITWGGPGQVYLVRKAVCISPLEAAYQVFASYSQSLTYAYDGPRPRDSRNIQNVLAFEGNLETLRLAAAHPLKHIKVVGFRQNRPATKSFALRTYLLRAFDGRFAAGDFTAERIRYLDGQRNR